MTVLEFLFLGQLALCCSYHILLCVYRSCQRLLIFLSSIQSNFLLDPKNSTLRESVPLLISYVFCRGVFCAPIHNIFFDTIMVSRCCLKFLSNYLFILNEGCLSKNYLSICLRNRCCTCKYSLQLKKFLHSCF